MSANTNTSDERRGGYRSKDFLIVLLLFLFTLTAAAQETKNPERIVIGEVGYILHTVQKNETLYSISRLYECTQEEVLAANKNISGVIKKGMILKIPDHSYQKPQSPKIDESRFVRHLVVSGDNYYQLKLKYGVDEEELLKYNPDLKDGLKTGKTILIPNNTKTETAAKEVPAVVSPVKATPVPDKFQINGKTFHVGLYLPISAAVTDSLKPTAKTLSYLAFYQGVLLAVDQLAGAGIKTKLFVYDTEKMVSSAESLVKKPEFSSMDLLVGPVYPEIQRVFSEMSAKNKIPMVSPLSSEDRFTKTNPYYFQMNPVRKLRLEATVDYLVKEFSKEKVIFLESENSSSETRMIHQLLNRKLSAHGSSTGQQVTFNIWANGTEELEGKLTADRPNILVMAEMNEVSVSIAMNRLTLLSKKFPLVLIGLQEFTRMQSIETENLHNVNLRFLASSFIDYSRPAVQKFIEDFKLEFGTEPSPFAFQGYDLTTCFLKSLGKTGNLSHGLPPGHNEGLLHTAYHFVKVSESGGYINDNFTVVEYANTFEVKSLGSIQHPE